MNPPIELGSKLGGSLAGAWRRFSARNKLEKALVFSRIQLGPKLGPELGPKYAIKWAWYKLPRQGPGAEFTPI